MYANYAKRPEKFKKINGRYPPLLLKSLIFILLYVFCEMFVAQIYRCKMEISTNLSRTSHLPYVCRQGADSYLLTYPP